MSEKKRDKVTTKRKRGRPARELPEPINRPIEEIVDAVLKAPPKREDEWDYLKPRTKSK